MSSHRTDAADLGEECCRGKVYFVTSYEGYIMSIGLLLMLLILIAGVEWCLQNFPLESFSFTFYLLKMSPMYNPCSN